jgi:hypothetical protein
MRPFGGCTTLALILAALAPASTARGEEPATKTLRIGTFDSRAVVLAYGNSALGRERLTGLRADLEKAKADGDSKRAEQLEAEGRHLQDLMHLQVFSNGSASNVLERITEALPAIAREAGVDLIVSQWELAYVTDAVQRVDVTARLVEHLQPSEQAMKWIADLGNRPPIPMEKLVMGPEE